MLKKRVDNNKNVLYNKIARKERKKWQIKYLVNGSKI